MSGQALIYAMLRELFALKPTYHSVTESIFLENLSLRFPFLRANEVTYSTRTRSSKDPFSLKSLSLEFDKPSNYFSVCKIEGGWV